MTDMKVSIAGVELASPVIAASGSFGLGIEYKDWVDMRKLGAISMKALTPAPREGNPPPRIAEAPDGILNCVGLQNPGVLPFVEQYLPEVEKLDTVIIANVSGFSAEDYRAVVIALEDYDSIRMYELNMATPNAADGGLPMGANEGAVRGIVEAVKEIASKPVIVKLTPNVTSIVRPAKAAVEAGADAISLINSPYGMAIDARNRRPILSANPGGLSGPAIKPIALRMVCQVAAADLGVPIIGMGGIMTGEDAAEFMVAGATAVEVGTATLRDPVATQRISEELAAFGEEEGLSSITELTGSLRS